jgi:hypothetical protein
LKAAPECLKFRQLAIDALEVRGAHRRDAAARLRAFPAERQDLAHVVEREAELLGAADEPELAQDLVRIAAVA